MENGRKNQLDKTGHDKFNYDNTNILEKIKNTSKRRVFEAYHIKQHKNMNRQHELGEFPNIYFNIDTIKQ